MSLARAHFEALPSPQALAERVAGWLCDLAEAKAGPFTLCLSGGSTPKALYERLVEPPFLARFPWSRTVLFWGDERFVPSDDARSNYRMTREAMLDRAPLLADNIHPVPTGGLTPEQAALAYERMLQAMHGSTTLDPTQPLFDATLLGLGPDGHTASMFPQTPVLQERTRWAAAVIGAKAEPRITLTYPALNSSRNAAFLVAGEDKRAILGRLKTGDPALPASHIDPVGDLWVFTDKAAEPTP